KATESRVSAGLISPPKRDCSSAARASSSKKTRRVVSLSSSTIPVHPASQSSAMVKSLSSGVHERSSRTSLAGFIVGSLAGEGPLLDAEEKLELLRLAVPCVPPDRTIIADVSEEGVHTAVKIARAAAEAGAHAVVSSVPHQYRN